MYVGKNGKEILKIDPRGAIKTFAVIEEAQGYLIEGPGHTFLYDMECDTRGNLYAAAEDRILKITSKGKVISLLQEKFGGPWGVCGIARDSCGTIYFAYDHKIEKLSPEGRRELFFDGGNGLHKLHAIVGIEFDISQRHLYACDGYANQGKLVQVALDADGSAGAVQTPFRDKDYHSEYIAVIDGGTVVIKGPWSEAFVWVKRDGRYGYFTSEPSGFGIETIALGRKGFDSHSLYGTNMNDGAVYRIALPAID